MIQLKVYPDNPKVQSEAIFLDLYETQPIKLTLSIEDITSAEATSVFSKTFKVPATRHNKEFFDDAFAIQGVLFDITIKKPAEVLVDGAEFREGHIRLQKIFINKDQDRVDYELLFLGETRDFSSTLAEKTLCQITFTDFDWEGLPVDYDDAQFYTDTPTEAIVIDSWNAFPELYDPTTGNPPTPAELNAGYADGNILFPLIDHGNNYNANGPTDAYIAVGNDANNFIENNVSIAASRLKPMIRAKRIWDQIFQDAGYTYKSEFLDSDRFRHMYVSAFGNNETNAIEIEQSQNTTIFQSSFSQPSQELFDFLYLPDNVVNSAGFYDVGTPAAGSKFTATVSSTQTSYYQLWAQADFLAQVEDSYEGYNECTGTIELYNQSTGQVLATGNSSPGSSQVYLDSRSLPDGAIGANNIIKIRVTSPCTDQGSQVYSAQWLCPSAPGAYTISGDLDCDYKQVDFIKDTLTAFRLVMQPDKTRPNQFIIEPWQDFIGSGDVYDWTDKLDGSKDFIAEPVFNTQSSTIEYSFAEDEDLINTFHQDNNKNAYGFLRFDSANELLKGKRDVQVTGISPTPVDQINEVGVNNHPSTQFIIPSIVEIDGENFERHPIKPNTRLLFYNGKQNIQDVHNYWNLGQQPNSFPYFPQVSPYETFPPTSESLNLNFFNDTRYYIDPSPGSSYFDQGPTLFDAYWSRYISSLYNKFSRKVTGTFILDNTDLQDLTFDDLIFINGIYYRPEKIINAEVGTKGPVKCELITVLDATANWRNEALDVISIIPYGPVCGEGAGSIAVQTNGTPPFTIENESGWIQTFNFPINQAPYNFTADGIVPGDHTITVTDALNRIYVITLTVPQNAYEPLSFQSSITNPTVCSGECNGAINLTPTGGLAPYTYLFSDGHTGATHTGICPGPYSWVITDANGCTVEGNVVLDCEEPIQTFKVQELTDDGSETLLGNIFTNPNVNGTNDFHCSNITTNPDYTNFPAYDWQWQEIAPYWQFEGPYNYTQRTNPNVINAGVNPNVPYFRGGSRQWNIPAGWAGTLKIVNDLELTNVQGLDLSQDNLYWRVYVDGVYQGDDDVPLPTLPINGSVVPFYNEYEYVADGTETFIQFFLYYKDNPPIQPIGPVVGYRGTAQWFQVNDCTLEDNFEYVDTNNLSLGDIVTLDSSQSCWEVVEEVDDIPTTATVVNAYDDCLICYGDDPDPNISWKLMPLDTECDASEDPQLAIYASATMYMGIGLIVKVDGSDVCYVAIEQSQVTPTEVISDTFKKCEECQSTSDAFYYNVTLCNDLASFTARASGPINIGGIYKMLTGPYAGECIQIISNSLTPASENIDTSTDYQTCQNCEPVPSIGECWILLGPGEWGFFSPGQLLQRTVVLNSRQKQKICLVPNTLNQLGGSGSAQPLYSICTTDGDCIN